MTEEKWIEKVTPSHKVEFLAVKEKLDELLGLGYSGARIWKALRDEGKLQMSLSQFRRYTGEPKAARTEKGGEVVKVGKGSEPEVPKSKRAQIEPPKPFRYNPNPVTKEEVINGTSREY